jgi:universal stress protein E
MQNVKNILVGVDLSHGERLVSADLTGPNREAVDRGLWLAARNQARLTFLAVLDLPEQVESHLHDDSALEMPNLDDAALAVLSGLVAEAAERGIAAEQRLAFGKPWHEMVLQVLRENHDILIVGTRKLTGLQRWIVGSTALKLLRTCPCPVWVTKPRPETAVAHILAATDLSETGAAVVRLAASLANAQGSELHVIHALEYPYEKALAQTESGAAQIDVYRTRARADAERKLAQQLSCPEVAVLPQPPQIHLEESLAEDAILEAIGKYQIELLVMGTLARTGMAGFLLGNTAERLLSQISCSLIAVKPPGFHSPVSLS